MLALLLLFAVGILHDILYAKFLLLVIEKRILLASLMSAVITLLSYGVFAAVLDQLMTGGYSKIVAYSVGAGVGTGLGMWRKKDDDRRA